jgi:oxygen-independent coproporphyrinogen-3 oxidase
MGEAFSGKSSDNSTLHAPNASPLQFPRTPATQTSQTVVRAAEISETMMMGLRLVREGISGQGFEKRFGQTLGQVFGSKIERLVGFGLLEWVETEQGAAAIRLTEKARLVGNQVFVEFI